MVTHCRTQVPAGSSYCPDCGRRLRAPIVSDEELAALFEATERALRAGDGPRARRNMKELLKLLGGGYVSSTYWSEEWERRFGPAWRSMLRVSQVG